MVEQRIQVVVFPPRRSTRGIEESAGFGDVPHLPVAVSQGHLARVGDSRVAFRLGLFAGEVGVALFLLSLAFSSSAARWSSSDFLLAAMARRFCTSANFRASASWRASCSALGSRARHPRVPAGRGRAVR